MSKCRLINILILFIAIFYSSCKKDNSVILTSEQSIINRAQKFFKQEIEGKISSHQIVIGDIGFIDKNPRKQLERRPLWDNATVMKLSSGFAVIIPVRYDKPFIIKSNVGGNKFYNINDLTKLLIYQDKDQHYHAELITSIPDSNYRSLTNEAFKGLLLVEDWYGNSIDKYKYELNGIIRKFRNIPEENSLSSMKRELSMHSNPDNLLRQDGFITICYEISGYNYSVNDPTNGYYWSEPAGCEIYFDKIDSGYGVNNTYLDASSYGNISTGDYGSSPIYPADKVLVVAGNNIIGNINDYNKCFTNVPGNVNTYEVKLCVAQPLPGTREAWEASGLNGSSANGNPVFVGHTFLIFTEKTPTQTISRNIGFYPESGVNPYSPSVQGLLNNDEIHDYNISLSITMTSSEFTTILNFVSQGNNSGYTYNLNSNNCTTFALNAVASAGINLQRTNGTWLSGGGLNPGDLGEDIRNMYLPANMTRNTNFVWHYNKGKCF